MRRGVRAWLAALALLLGAGAGAQTAIQFLDHPQDQRLSYEKGAQALAERIAAALPAAVAQVEAAQYGPFAKPVRVLVTASEDSYLALSGARGESRAATFFERVFISPRLAREPDALAGVLTHELSHLHLAQRIPEAAGRRIPTWFHEGLAVLVSGGGGAEKVPAEDARAAIREGRHFTPEPVGDPRFIRSAAQFGLTPHMYYRQCALFVSFLRDADPAAFRTLMEAVAAQQPFDQAVARSLGASVENLWQRFVAEVAKDR